MTPKDFPVGQRVGFSADFIRAVGSQTTEDLRRKFGVVVGHIGDKFVRVKFDGEENPRSISACNLRKPR